jgi:hypothetical protein
MGDPHLVLGCGPRCGILCRCLVAAILSLVSLVLIALYQYPGSIKLALRNATAIAFPTFNAHLLVQSTFDRPF